MIKLFQAFAALILLISSQPVQPKETEYYQVIPDEAIRLRILAESDDPRDQAIKHEIRDVVNEEITIWVEELTEIETARDLIQERLTKIEGLVAETLEAHDPTMSFKVEYDTDVAFPDKLYDRYVYPAGEYEAILITLGEGKGSNWWCVLFPPLCFLDFSMGTTVAEEDADNIDDEVLEETIVEDLEEEPETEVSFFLFEWIEWLLNLA